LHLSAESYLLRSLFCLRSTGWSTTTDEDHTHEQENNDRRKLQDRDPELLFGVPEDTEQTDDANREEEHNDPDSDVYLSSSAPPLDCKTSDDEFEWKDDGLNEVSGDS